MENKDKKPKTREVKLEAALANLKIAFFLRCQKWHWANVFQIFFNLCNLVDKTIYHKSDCRSSKNNQNPIFRVDNVLFTLINNLITWQFVVFCFCQNCKEQMLNDCFNTLKIDFLDIEMQELTSPYSEEILIFKVVLFVLSSLA